MSALDDNRPRHRPGSDHVESWFLRANHPTRPLSFWLKATILGRAKGPDSADAWCSVFDGEGPRARGHRSTVPLSEARFPSDGGPIELADCTFALDPARGSSRGRTGPFAWDLRWTAIQGPLGQPLCMLPSRRMVDGAFPRNKLLTPAPALRFEGHLSWGEQTWSVDDWLGMQGHNWGRAHSPEYAWGQCLFTDAQGQPFAWVEAAAGRIALGPLTTPTIALMTVRRGDRVYRFDRLVDLWNRTSESAFPRWSLRMRGPAGRALLTMSAHPDRMVCLGYDNPDGRRSFCLNSKLASVSLRLNPVNEDGFTCVSPHGGALEFLRPDPVPELQEVV